MFKAFRLWKFKRDLVHGLEKKVLSSLIDYELVKDFKLPKVKLEVKKAESKLKLMNEAIEKFVVDKKDKESRDKLKNMKQKRDNQAEVFKNWNVGVAKTEQQMRQLHGQWEANVETLKFIKNFK